MIYMKFKAKNLIDKISEYNGKFSATIVGRGNVNSWMGNQTAQIFIDDIEINEINNNMF